MSARRKSPIPTQIHTHPKTPLRLKLPNLLPPGDQIPHIYPAIICRAGKILPILAQCDSPDLPSLVPVLNLALLYPVSGLRNAPYLDFPTEACAGCNASGARGADVVAAELVGPGEGLCEGDVGGGCGVDFYGGCTGGGENLGGCYGEGEDVCDVGWEMLAGCLVEG